MKNTVDLYKVLKEAGLFYFYIASCISSDNPSTIHSCQERLTSLKDLLSSVPKCETEDKKRVQQGIAILERELSNIQNITRVLFLDFDGVLNTSEYQARLRESEKPTYDEYGPVFDPSAVKNLKRIVDAVPNLKIVISSSWKLEGLERMRELWKARHLPGEVADITPDYAAASSQMLVGKGREIKQWIAENAPEHCKYAILDDVPDFLPEQTPFFIQTTPKSGLTQAIADRIINYMQFEWRAED